MPIRDVAAMNRSLDNDYGTTRGPNAADSHELALFDNDPTIDGVELDAGDCPGYARPDVDPADWAVAAGGQKSTSAPIQFANSTDPWTTQAKWWALVDGDDHTTVWDCAALNEALSVTDAGLGPAIQPTVFYANTVDIPE